MIRIEFWNGHVSSKKKYEKHDGHIATKHNPCLWTNHADSEKPWRLVYPEALEYIDKFETGNISCTELLHGLRYVAYGYGKRNYDNTDVIWPGNLTIRHKPKLVVIKGSIEFTLCFYFDGDGEPIDNGWKCEKTNGAHFYWEL